MVAYLCVRREFMIDDFDKDIAYEFIFVNLLIEVLERDSLVIEDSKLKFKEPYLNKINKLILNQFNLKKKLRTLMNKKGIRVQERTVIDKEFIEYPFIVRGYDDVQRLWTAAIRKILTERLKDLLEDNPLNLRVTEEELVEGIRMN
jgi:hypothetical protein